MTTDTDLMKLTVNLVPSAVTALADAAELSGHARTDTVNRALHVYAAIVEAAALHGGRLLVDYNGEFLTLAVRRERRLNTTAALGLALAASAFLAGLGAVVTWALWGWH